MLNEYQVRRVWDNMIAAETRALYFGDLASHYTFRKQWITGVSFLLSSGAAAAIIAKTPPLIPALLALVVAAASAYSIATGLDGRVRTMAKLHSTWNEIATLYDRLWNHTGDSDAERQLANIIEREREPSEMALLFAPNDESRLDKWECRVFAMRGLGRPA
jgi:hypothetical protein